MRSVLKLLVISLIGAPSLVLAENQKPYYIELSGGFSNAYIPHNYGMPSGRYGSAALASIALGHQFNERIAFDLDLTYRGEFTNNDGTYDTSNNDNASVSTSIKSLSTMMNGYYYYYNDLPNFKPYITGGVGVAVNKTGALTMTFTDEDGERCAGVDEGDKTVNFAWKVGTGIKYQLGDNFEVDLRYQFVNLGNVKQGKLSSSYINGELIASENEINKSSALKSHEFLVGIVWKF